MVYLGLTAINGAVSFCNGIERRNNTFTRFVPACQIIVISSFAKSKHSNNEKVLIWISSKTFSLLKSKITKIYKNEKHKENDQKNEKVQTKRKKQNISNPIWSPFFVIRYY